MAQNYKIPPKFDDKVTYETWRNEIKMWTLVTDLDPKKQALAVALSLTGRTRETALELKAEDLNNEDGMDILLNALDVVYKKDIIDSAYEAYTNFESFKKIDTMIMSDYINEFEHRYTRTKKHDMSLPDAVLAFKLLDNSNLNTKERQLALTACPDIKYDTMRSALKRIFSEDHSCTAVNSNTPFKIKQEPVETIFATERSTTEFRPRNMTYRNNNNTNLKGTNPLNKFGRRTRCAICESVFHWAKDCYLNERNKTEKSESVNITLFTNEKHKDEIFMMEAYGTAVIDTACTRTVCGKKWLDEYRYSLRESSDSMFTRTESNQQFKFGDGVEVKSIENIMIPALIGNTSCNISTEVVNCDIPLLLSKDSLKKANTVLNLSNDSATMFGEPVRLNFTSSGHYCVNLKGDNSSVEANQIEEVLTTVNTKKYDKCELVKLHKQFGHATSEKLIILLKTAGVGLDIDITNMLQDIVKECETCMKFKRPLPKPAVSVPLATKFNHMVAMDLHEIQSNVWYLHIIDLFTRYSAAVVIFSKRSDIIVKQFIQIWISVHGPPKFVLTDNGREFDNKEFHDMAENFNITVKTTPAYSPWSNGILERHNRTLSEILSKVKHDTTLDWQTALAWSVNAKNCLCNVHGFSAHQLVYGENPNLPSVLIDDLPALEGSSESKCVTEHLIGLHEARKAYIEVETSDRIRRALRKQTRNYDNYITGDIVYYKRDDSNEWKGPGVVIGQDGVVVFVRHGGSYIRVHKCRLTKLSCELSDLNEHMELSIDSSIDEQSANDNKNSTHEDVNIDDFDDDQTVELNEQSVTVQNSVSSNSEPDLSRICLKPKVGQYLNFTEENGNSCVVKVLSRAGKATSALKDWYNIEYIQPASKEGVKISADISRLKDVQFTDLNSSESSDSCFYMVEDVCFDQAKIDELNKWIEFDVYEELPDTGQKCISTRWICTVKGTSTGDICKARLVARGFEDTDKNNVEKDSPTCAKESLRLVLAIIAQYNWKPKSMDIKTAFLQGQELSRDIYLKPPKEANVVGVVWHLKKCVYGLSDASLCWYNKVKEVMLDSGSQVSTVDPAVFYWVDKDGLKGLLASHVDDFIWSGSDNFEQNFIERIRKKLNVGREEIDTFKYVGLNLTSDENKITLDQHHYIKSLEPIELTKHRAIDKESSLTVLESNAMRSKIGQIMWIASQTRPDVMFDASLLASSFNQAKVKDLVEVNKVIKKIKSENVNLKFQHLGKSDSLKLLVFSDASLGNLPDGGSQGGYLVFLVGDNGKFSLVSWQSKKVRRVVRSTLAAEALAMSEAVDEAIFLAFLYTEITLGHACPTLLPLECITDNHSLHQTVHSNNHVSEKRLRIEISGIKQLMNSKQISALKWSSSKTQIADCLTKKGSSSLVLLGLLEKGTLQL